MEEIIDREAVRALRNHPNRERESRPSSSRRPDLGIARAELDEFRQAEATQPPGRASRNERNAAGRATTATQPRTAGRRRPRETSTANAQRSFDLGMQETASEALYNLPIPLPGSLQLPASFALPILGSRDLTEMFNEIIDASRQEPVRFRARRDEPGGGAATGGTRPAGRGTAGGTGGTGAGQRERNTTSLMRELYGAGDPPSSGYPGPATTTSTGFGGHGGKLARSPPNWFLKPGQTWNGWQHVQHWPPGTSERWSVRVVLDFVNFEKGEVFGTMTASNVPGAENNVVTYFEGEIIDNENSTFYSNPDASARTCLAELRHWSRFPSFRPLRDSVLEEDGRAPALSASGKVFMRWKEKCFLSGGANCRLSIAGLYYVTLDRVNGDIHAYYWDPNSAPEQKMNLKVGSSHQQGYALPMFKVA